MADVVLSETKLCSTCGEPIPLVAKKCTHCDTFQDWRRYVSFSTTVLALLTALFSVGSVFFPVIFRTIRGENSNLTAAVGRVGENEDDPILFVTNTGTRPGAVTSVKLQYYRSEKLIGFASLHLNAREGRFFVEPGKGTEFHLTATGSNFTPQQVEYFRNLKVSDSCEMYVWTTDFFGKSKLVETPFLCTLIEPYVRKITSAVNH